MSSIIILSGGQDSTTCLYHHQIVTKALNEEDAIVAGIFFDYGQKHLEPERECARYHARKNGFELVEVPMMGIAAVAESALLNYQQDIAAPHPLLKDLPASFVPGRNLLFITYASALAMKMNATHVITGVCETDYSGYPDCRESTIMSLEQTIQRGMGFEYLQIVTPLMHLSKADTFMLAMEGGFLLDIVQHTHTGYNGKHAVLYDWGWGPQKEEELDPASTIRRRGFYEFVEQLGIDEYLKWRSAQSYITTLVEDYHE